MTILQNRGNLLNLNRSTMKKYAQEYRKWGWIFAIGWNVAILSVYAIVCAIEGVPFSKGMEADTWVGFWICYALATAVWFYIGYALRKEYLTKKFQYIAAFPDMPRESVNTLFQLYFWRKYARILTVVAGTAIPWYIIANVSDEITQKDAIYICLFIFIAMGSLFAVKKLTDKILKMK